MLTRFITVINDVILNVRFFFSIFQVFYLLSRQAAQPPQIMEPKTGVKLKTKLTIAEQIITLAGITLFGIVLSILIGKGLVRQSILTAATLYLLTGIRPEIIFATLCCIKRDFM